MFCDSNTLSISSAWAEKANVDPTVLILLLLSLLANGDLMNVVLLPE
jgi:hypothetical protein